MCVVVCVTMPQFRPFIHLSIYHRQLDVNTNSKIIRSSIILLHLPRNRLTIAILTRGIAHTQMVIFDRCDESGLMISVGRKAVEDN